MTRNAAPPEGTWLVTGGAGYVGAHVVRALVEGGIGAVALDNLSTGRREFVARTVPFIEADVLDRPAVAAALAEHRCRGVIHCAGYKYAGESMSRPEYTFRQNVEGTAAVLDAMRDAGVARLVFSSSAGVYGSPNADVVTEETECRPESPYGRSKLEAERIIGERVAATRDDSDPLAATSLRYLNVIGSRYLDVYDASPFNLLPRAFAALAAGRRPVIHGADYPTPDGTCVRDYVDVGDVSRAHVAAARALSRGVPIAPAYNLGSGRGTSVREILSAVRSATGIDVEPEIGPARPGDPARIVASGAKAGVDLDWRCTATIDEMVASAWRAAPERRA